MHTIKPKEPLMAAMLTFLLIGLGHIYTRRINRGIIWFIVWLLSAISISIAILRNILDPVTTNLVLSFSIMFLVFVVLWLFAAIDAYRCAKKYNSVNNLLQEITKAKKAWLIIGIIFFAFIFNLSQLILLPSVIYIRSNIVQAFRIPTGAMRPTLLEGDMILVDKRIYKQSEPKRGDALVFIYPQNPKKIFIKRLVGFPGEKVEIRNKSIFINDTVLKEPLIFTQVSYYNRGEFAQEDKAVTVPQDNYFVLGDNSASSQDSRYWGFLPKKNIIGKAYKIYFPTERSGSIQ